MTRSQGFWERFGHSRAWKFASYLQPNIDPNQPLSSPVLQLCVSFWWSPEQPLNVVGRSHGGGVLGFQTLTLTLSLTRSLSVSAADERLLSASLSVCPYWRLVVAAADVAAATFPPQSLGLSFSHSLSLCLHWQWTTSGGGAGVAALPPPLSSFFFLSLWWFTGLRSKGTPLVVVSLAVKEKGASTPYLLLLLFFWLSWLIIQ